MLACMADCAVSTWHTEYTTGPKPDKVLRGEIDFKGVEYRLGLDVLNCMKTMVIFDFLGGGHFSTGSFPLKATLEYELDVMNQWYTWAHEAMTSEPATSSPPPPS